MMVYILNCITSKLLKLKEISIKLKLIVAFCNNRLYEFYQFLNKSYFKSCKKLHSFAVYNNT